MFPPRSARGGVRMIVCASVCVYGHHKDRYGPQWVARLHSAMARHIGYATRHVCLTDRPDMIPAGVDAIDIGDWWQQYAHYKDGLYNPVGGWWAKVKLFDAALWNPNDLIVYSDLDNLIV